MSTLRVTETPLWLELRRSVDGDTPANRILRFLRIVAPPVPVDFIALSLGFGVFDDPAMKDYWGEVDLSRHPALIRLRSPQPQVRRRFTIAHEIGHAMLHDMTAHHRDDSFAGSMAEIQANRFAAELLMPDWMVGPASMSGRGTSSLAGLFDVSFDAMDYRLRTMRTPR